VRQSESRVAAIAARNRLIDFVAFELPAGRDGFLATNSLIAFCVLMGRAYCEVAGQKPNLPKEFGGLLRDKRLLRRTDVRDSQLLPVLSRQTVVVLHGPSTVAAAVDLESKFTEAALGQVQVCDYRQFAHGLHHWLAKRPNEIATSSSYFSGLAMMIFRSVSMMQVVRIANYPPPPLCQLVCGSMR
jgi:hypothetical protein